MNRLPSWLKKSVPNNPTYRKTVDLLNDLKLNTVCKEARCPNIGECYSRGTATFMILGNTCTRNCRFCAIDLGKPTPIDKEEPQRLAEAIRHLNLKHVVITMVTRDDLKDGGSNHFSEVIKKIRTDTSVTIEVLTSDFRGRAKSIDQMISAKPDIFNHNIETVERLQKTIRPMMSYQRSLDVLKRVKKQDSKIILKSGLMLGLGEKQSEIEETLKHLKQIGCDVLTLGQYLQPANSPLKVERFLTPQEFNHLGDYARLLGFSLVESAPFVRSSYHAEKVMKHISIIS